VGEIAKHLMIFGAILLLVGLLLAAFGRLHLPLGHLPGDIYYRGKNVTFYFPLTTCILLSVAISGIFYLINHFRH